MAQKVKRNVFIHYNVRLRFQNMKRARNQSEQEQYYPINLDYIFAEDDPLLPWLEHREKEMDITNSEEENYPNLIQRTTQSTQEEVIEVQEDSSATQSDPGHNDDDDDDDDNDNDDASDSDGDGDGGGGDGGGGSGGGIGSTSETFVPSTYPYPHSSTSGDRGKSPIREEEEEEDEEEDEREEYEDVSKMNLIERRSPWPTGYQIYIQRQYIANIHHNHNLFHLG